MPKKVTMHWGVRLLVGATLLTSYVSPLTAQSWNSEPTLELVRRAVV